MRTLALLAMLGMVIPAAAQEPAHALPSVELPAELDRVLRDYEEAWRAGDEARLAALFTEDGFVSRRTGWVRGRAAIEEAYRDSQGELRLRALEFRVADEVGYVIGAYAYPDTPAGRDAGRFILALRREPGGPWRIAADLDGANRPE